MPVIIQRAPLPSLVNRLMEPRRFVQVVAGPRQVGKTTLVQQALAALARAPQGHGLAQHSVSADAPGAQPATWLATQWEVARALAGQAGACLLVIDEVQKIPNWTDTLKRLWDEDTAAARDIRVVVLGSAPLLIAKGLTESLAGRFEITRLGHWRFAEMREAFDMTLEECVFFGTYPGAATLIRDPVRWAAYVRDALVESTLSKDVLQMTQVQKPALLRRVLDLACHYSGQMLSYQKMLGQLDDAGNTTTLAHYLHLLESAGMACGLQKYMGQVVRQRASSPKLQVFNNALLGSVAVVSGDTLASLKQQPERWGRMVESAVGAELLARHVNHQSTHPCIHYWNDGQREVDYVLQQRPDLFALEVKSGVQARSVSGLAAFCAMHPTARPLILGTGGLPLETWFAG